MRISDWSSDVCSSDLFRHLVLLDALLKRHSVSAAARELDLPQPTASHGLARLRKALGDPLLVRARDGMEPTPRAEAIAGVVQQLLELRRDLAEGGQTFSPDRLKQIGRASWRERVCKYVSIS